MADNSRLGPEPGVVLSLVLVDEHALALDGLKALLDAEPGMKVVATATGGPEAQKAVERHRPDVLIIGASMHPGEGVEATAGLRENGAAVPILILCTTLADPTLVRCLKLGLEELSRGDQVDFHPLTPREWDVLVEVVAGRSNRATGTVLGITEGTVKIHLHRVFRKLEVSSRTQLAALAWDRGWVRALTGPPPPAPALP